MKPGEMITEPGELDINVGKPVLTLSVANSGDRPIQVGSHYHFYEANNALLFDRDKARGYRLDIPAGTAVRFEPGQSREVNLVPYGGERVVYGFQGKVSAGSSLWFSSRWCLWFVVNVLTQDSGVNKCPK